MSKLAKRETPTGLRRSFGPGSFGQLRREMESMFEDFFGERGLSSTTGDMIPRLDVSETEQAVLVETDLPGIKPEDVNIEINDNYLSISGSHSEEQSEQGDGRRYHRVERRSGSFSRTVMLPCAVKSDAVEAELKNGVLTVTLPKAEEARRQKIKVKGK